MHFAGHQLGDINSFNGIPFFSSAGRRWIRDKTGDEPAFPPLAAPLWENQQCLSQRAAIILTSDVELPPIDAVQKYFKLFRMTTFRFVFPVVEVELFQETIDTAYGGSQTDMSSEVATSKACVMAFTALMNFFEGCLEDAPVDGEFCALQAQQLMPHLLYPTLTNLQATLMLVSLKVSRRCCFCLID